MTNQYSKRAVFPHKTSRQAQPEDMSLRRVRLIVSIFDFCILFLIFTF